MAGDYSSHCNSTLHEGRGACPDLPLKVAYGDPHNLYCIAQLCSWLARWLGQCWGLGDSVTSLVHQTHSQYCAALVSEVELRGGEQAQTFIWGVCTNKALFLPPGPVSWVQKDEEEALTQNMGQGEIDDIHDITRFVLFYSLGGCVNNIQQKHSYLTYNSNFLKVLDTIGDLKFGRHNMLLCCQFTTSLPLYRPCP